MDDSFVKAPISVPKSSGFDKSHQNLLSTKVGTITPILVDELIPGSKVDLKLALSASLPPLASETFMRCSIKTEAFFCPSRLLCGSFESFFTDEGIPYQVGSDNVKLKGALPYVVGSDPGHGTFPTWQLNLGKPGTLSDYLGYRSNNPNAVFTRPVTLMPFLAYHRIWNDHYRNSLVQRECFVRSLFPNRAPSPVGASGSYNSVAYAPYIFYTNGESTFTPSINTEGRLILADGVSVFGLRQRNFGLDYFTTATPQPQQGDAQVVSFDTSGTSGQFSIATLRASNSLQQFKERNNLLGGLYVEQLKGRYGVRPSDGIAQRSIYLGRGEFEVYSKGIFANSDIEGNNTSNPFTSVGTRFGSAYASGSDFHINFSCTEPGYLFVMATLVPRVTYSSGVDRMLTRYVGDGSLVDMANPILQNVGPEPIYASELTAAASNSVFGYTDRYASFKTKQDSLHGLLRDGQSLQSFALQRSFDVGANVGINSSFLEIPTNYLDQVAAVQGSISDYGCWLDCYFNYRCSMPLQKYSLPSLQDPAYEHGKTIIVSKGGNKL